MQQIIIKKLFLLLNKSKKTHTDYISNGKIFFYTKKLIIINKKILVLIKSINFEQEKELKCLSLELKEHLEEWIINWNKQRKIKNPDNNDVFIFTGYKTFPKNLDKVLTILLKHS